jgi:hypothetical protein
MPRSFLVALLVLALVPLSVAASVSWWTASAVADRAGFVATTEAALDEPETRSFLARRLARGLFDAVIRPDTGVRVIVATVLGAGPGATDAEIVLALEPRVAATLDEPAVRAARTRIAESVHAVVIGGTAEGVRLDDDQLIVDARVILEAVLDAIDGRLAGLGLALPAGPVTEIVLADVPGLSTASAGVRTAERLAPILLLLAVVLGLLAPVMARDRRGALVATGGALVFGALLTVVIVMLGAARIDVSDPVVPGDVVSGIYGSVTRSLLVQTGLVAAAGGVLVVLGLAWPRRTPPRRRSRSIG